MPDSLEEIVDRPGVAGRIWGKYQSSYLWNVNTNNVVPRIPGVIASGYFAYKMQEQGVDPVAIAASAPFVMRVVALPISTALNYYWGRRKNRENTGEASNRQVVKYLASIGGVGAMASVAWTVAEGAVAYALTQSTGMSLAATIPTMQVTGIACKRALFSYFAVNSGTFNLLENRSMLDSKWGRAFVGIPEKFAAISKQIFKGLNGSAAYDEPLSDRDGELRPTAGRRGEGDPESGGQADSHPAA